MKIPDLSVRPARNGGRSPVPDFRDQNRYVSTVTANGAGVFDIFNPGAALTVQWITLQISASVTIQEYLNGSPFGAALTLGAGAVIQFPGTLLANNDKLQFSVSGATSISFEVVYVRAIRPDLIETDLTIIAGGSSSTTAVNLSQWGGAAVTAALADAPVGNEVAPVVRDIFRKKTTVLTRTPLAAGATFQSAWFDTELTGDVYVLPSVRSDVAGTNLQILECDDISGTTYVPASIQSSIQSVSYSANTATRAPGIVRQRYFAIVFTNGATPQTTFELTVTVCNFMVSGALSGGQLSTGALTVNPFPIFVNQGGGGVGADALINVNDIPGTAGAFPMRNVIHEFNGTNWDRVRGNWNTVTGDSGAKTATFNGATQTNFNAVGAYISILLGAVSGTTPTMGIQLQFSPDGGTSWIAIGPALPNMTLTGQSGLIGVFPTNWSQTPGATPAGLTSGASVPMFLNMPLPRTWRLVYTIGGTTPSFTINSVNVNYIRG